jgi:tRNA-2-methylthio-N6-dimethylallyladenosine synthase
MDGQVPKAVVQERYERLVALQDDIAWRENQRQVGRVVDLLVAEGEGRKDGATARLSGRAPDNRLVHFAPGPALVGTGAPRPGDVVTVEITYAAPHHLVSDAEPKALRRTRAGDAWAARTGAVPTQSASGAGPGVGTVRQRRAARHAGPRPAPAMTLPPLSR